MTTKEIKEPGKIWHGYQRVKATAKNWRSLKKDLAGFGQNAGFSAGSVALLTQRAVFTAMTTLPTILLYSGIVGAGIFGFQALKESKNNGLTSKAVRSGITAAVFGFGGFFGAAVAPLLPAILLGSTVWFGYNAYKEGKDALYSSVVESAVNEAKTARIERKSQPSLFSRLAAKLSFKGSKNDNSAEPKSSVNNVEHASEQFNEPATPTAEPTAAELQANQEAEEKRKQRALNRQKRANNDRL